MDAALRTVFDTYSVFGVTSAASQGMTSAKFMKIAKDARLPDKRLTTTDIDLAFTKYCPKGAKKLTFDSFLTALDACAARKGVPPETVLGLVAALSASGPSNSGTQAQANKFHDDKSLYTGVYAKGGPTKVPRAHGLAGAARKHTRTTSAMPPPPPL